MITVANLKMALEKAEVINLWSKELNAYLEVDHNCLRDALHNMNEIYELPLVVSEDEYSEEEDVDCCERVLYLDPEGVNPDSKL